jgi:NitT/TauT family transport system permease protein
VALALLVVWELLVRAGVVLSRSLPPPSAIGRAFGADVQQAEVWEALGSTMGSWAIGLTAVIVVGVPVGLLLGVNRIAYLATQPSFEFIRTIPSIAALPLLILMFGTGVKLAAVMVFLGSLWPVLIQTMYGVRDVDPATKDTGRAYGLRRSQLFTRIVLPSALPYIATGIRLAAVIGLLLSVASSLIAGGGGIGFMITNASFSGVPELAYARIALTGIVGLLLTLLLTLVQNKVLFWHASVRKVLT